MDYRVLDVRRPIRSLGSLMDSGCDVHFTKNRCWTSKDDGKELDMIRSGGVFFVSARPSKLSSRETNTLELNPMTAAEVEQAPLAREHAALGTPGPGAGATLDGDGEPAVRIKVPTGPATPSVEKNSAARGFRTRALSKLVSMVHCGASGGQTAFEVSNNQIQMKPCQELSLISRISDKRRTKYCQSLPSMQPMLVTKAFSGNGVGIR